MRFLLDENLPRSAVELLNRYNHEVFDARDAGLRGVSDSKIADYAQKHELCLLTSDLGFADIRSYPPGVYSGLIVLRLPAKATSKIILNLLEGFLKHTEIVSQLQGKLIIVEKERIRVRKE
jgi:predicted nuclease of predicted toxin-antitoxin system